MFMTGVVSGDFTLKDKTKSKPLVDQKVKLITKSVVSIFFSVSLKNYQHYKMWHKNE